MRSCRALLLAVAAVCTIAVPARATAPAVAANAQAQTLQAVLDDARRRTGAPGASATIIRDGEIIWRGSSGSVNLRTHKPVTADTLYSLASVTKMFVATMVVRLKEEGLLRLDDPIAKYVPSYIPDGHVVTVRELLGHTSGYPDVEGDADVIRWLDNPNFKWRREIIMRHERRATFKPGTQFSYCNSCYVILGAVIESAGKTTVGGAFDRFITDPLGISALADFDRRAQFAPRIAHGYDLQNGKLVDTFEGARDLGVPTSVWGVVWTDGGIVASSDGVARFTDVLFGGRLVSHTSLMEMMKPGPDRSYGLGNAEVSFDSHEWHGHDGFYSGFTTESWYDFSRRLTITVLTNRTDNNGPAGIIWNRLARAYDRLP